MSSPLAAESFINYCYDGTIVTESIGDVQRIFNRKMFEVKSLKEKANSVSDPKDAISYLKQAREILLKAESEICKTKLTKSESIKESLDKVVRPLIRGKQTREDMLRWVSVSKANIDGDLKKLTNPKKYKKLKAICDRDRQKYEADVSAHENDPNIKALRPKQKALALKIAKALNQKMKPALRKYCNGRGTFIVDTKDAPYEIYLSPNPNLDIRDKLYDEFSEIIFDIYEDLKDEMLSLEVRQLKHLRDKLGVYLEDE